MKTEVDSSQATVTNYDWSVQMTHEIEQWFRDRYCVDEVMSEGHHCKSNSFGVPPSVQPTDIEGQPAGPPKASRSVGVK